MIKNRIRPGTQVYGNYTAEDFKVWKTLYNRQYDSIILHGSKDYLKALDEIQFSPDHIPDFIAVNQRLKKLTGWELKTVPCISPPQTFFKLLSEKKFTATCWLRSFSELDYIEEPDMFHDVFGHTPLLTNHDYVIFFKALGDIGLKHIDNEQVINMLQRLYWFTIEFGLIQEDGEIKYYGAGIISSKSETAHALNKLSKKRDFNVAEVMNHSFRTDVIQEEYYVIQSFNQLSEAITEIEAEIMKSN